MPQGSKQKYTAKQKRQAEAIEASYEQKGIPEKKAEAIAWATVNKQSGGCERSGAGKEKPEAEKTEARKDSAHNALITKQEKAKPHPLESETKHALLAQARTHQIPNRSNMNKPELILALRNINR